MGESCASCNHCAGEENACGEVLGAHACAIVVQLNDRDVSLLWVSSQLLRKIAESVCALERGMS
jgi:hypothetical protein